MLHLLFKLPVVDLTDRHYEASGVMGNAVLELKQRLGNTANFHERVHVAGNAGTRRLTNRTLVQDLMVCRADKATIKAL